jgi:hypothetical protein
VNISYSENTWIVVANNWTVEIDRNFVSPLRKEIPILSGSVDCSLQLHPALLVPTAYSVVAVDVWVCVVEAVWNPCEIARITPSVTLD